MGLFANVVSQPSGQAQAYPQPIPVQQPSALGRVGEIADILLTGGLFHALNQRSLQQGLLRQQAMDRAQMAGMFQPGSTTQSAPAPVPDASSGVNLFAGGQYGAAPTQTFGGNSVQVTPPSIPTPQDFAPVAARAAMHGTDVAPFMAAIQAAQPKYQIVNGQLVDTNRPGLDGKRVGVNLTSVNNRLVDTQNPDNANITVPQVDKGQVVNYDARGVPIGVSNLPGNAQAQADIAGAISTAQERAKAGLDLVDVPLADGSTVKLPRLTAARILGGQSSAPGGGVSTGFGVTQTPAAKALAEERAKTQGQREQLQPKEWGALQDLNNTSTTTSQIIHQILGDTQDPKTGAWVPGGKPQASGWTTGALGELLHQVPGTPQHDLDQQLEHVRAMTSIEQLQNLRDNSPTGAGLGRVTQSEINLLAAMRGSIDQGQRLPQFQANLRRQLGMLDGMIANRHKVYNETYGAIEQPTPGSAQPKAPAYSQGPSREALMAEAKRRGLIH